MVNRCVDILQLDSIISYYSNQDYYNYNNNPEESRCKNDYVYYKKELRRPSAKTIMEAYLPEISKLLKYWYATSPDQSIPISEYIIAQANKQ
jgi:hypothetical protein